MRREWIGLRLGISVVCVRIGTLDNESVSCMVNRGLRDEIRMARSRTWKGVEYLARFYS